MSHLTTSSDSKAHNRPQLFTAAAAHKSRSLLHTPVQEGGASGTQGHFSRLLSALQR